MHNYTSQPISIKLKYLYNQYPKQEIDQHPKKSPAPQIGNHYSNF